MWYDSSSIHDYVSILKKIQHAICRIGQYNIIYKIYEKCISEENLIKYIYKALIHFD